MTKVLKIKRDKLGVGSEDSFILVSDKLLFSGFSRWGFYTEINENDCRARNEWRIL